MDQVKIGKFIAAMRKARGLTQEVLGEKLGVTNKTVSRWETGAYMPDVGKLQDLAALLGVSVNELLSGERIESKEAFTQKADENLLGALAEPSAFRLEERVRYFKGKWLRDHRSRIVLWAAVWVLLFAAALWFRRPVLCALLIPLGLVPYGILRNQMMIYVEAKAYDGSGPDQ
ncbi:MAG: helix-turn-helix domain-containing protein [Candidatus Avoscillospira sp.]